MINFPFTPRDYQLTARHDCNKALNKGDHPLLVMPTGTGKTKTAAMIISDRINLGETVYIIAPQIEIFEQLLNDYAFLNPGYINDEGIKGRDRSLYVCMALSLVNIIRLIPESLYPNVIITDECHHSAADTWEMIYTFFGKAQRMGMTATPVRTDNKPLGHLYTDIVEPITIKEAIHMKFLTPPIVIGSEEYINMIPTGDEVDEKKQAEILGETQIVGDLIEAYERVLNGLPMLIACCTFKHAEEVRDSFREAGWIGDHIHSGLSKSERKGMLNRIRSGKTNILTTVGIGIEGMDISGLHGLAYLRKTISTTIFVQFNGRPMRLSGPDEKKKKNCYIFDFVGNCVIHGMPDRIRKWSLTDGIEETDEDKPAWQKCPDCGVYNHISNTECHYCGADLTEEGRKEGTCRRCKNWVKGECTQHLNAHHWLFYHGCLLFTKKGRSLPATIDGELVAINTDREIQSLKERAEQKKEEQKELFEKEEIKRLTAEPISSVEKRQIVQKGLFADQGRRSLFKEALEG